jgi:hypothetical protein
MMIAEAECNARFRRGGDTAPSLSALIERLIVART